MLMITLRVPASIQCRLYHSPAASVPTCRRTQEKPPVASVAASVPTSLPRNHFPFVEQTATSGGGRWLEGKAVMRGDTNYDGDGD